MFVDNTNCVVSLHNTFSKCPLTSSFVDLDIFVFFLPVSAPKSYMYPPPLPHSCHMSSQRIHLDLITLLKYGWQYKFHGSVYYAVPPAPSYLFPSRPKDLSQHPIFKHV